MTNPLDDRPRSDIGSIIVKGEVVPTDLDGFAAWLNTKQFAGGRYFVGGQAPNRYLGERNKPAIPTK